MPHMFARLCRKEMPRRSHISLKYPVAGVRNQLDGLSGVGISSITHFGGVVLSMEKETCPTSQPSVFPGEIFTARVSGRRNNFALSIRDDCSAGGRHRD
jgi:hypothetical protein